MDIRVCTLCSGYDSQMMALKRIEGLNVDLVYWSEIDENAIKAHDAVFPEFSGRNLGDMTKIDWSQCEDFDVLTYSTPCTDISNAGLQKGMDKDSDTRSSIIWSVENCVKVKHPKVLVMENVKNIVSKRFRPFFDEWCRLLESYGYKNSWKVMNAKDYGVRQNRERLIMVSVLDDEEFKFPSPIPFKDELSAVLEHNVSEEYYIDKDVISPFVTDELRKMLIFDDTKYLQSPERLEGQVGQRILFWSRDAKGKVLRRIPREYCPCITSFASSKFFTQTVMVLEYEGDEDVVNLAQLRGKKYRIRFLTPREAFRLMDVKDDDIDKIFSAECTKLFLFAGNSIVVSVLEIVFRKLFNIF